jgi:hypothetical protein
LKNSLRFQAHHPIRPGAEHERRRLDRSRIRQQSRGSIVEIEKHILRDLAKDQLVLPVRGRLLGIVCEHTGLHVAFHVARPHEHPFQAQERHGERDVEFHAKGRRGQDQRANPRRVVMDPCRHAHGPDAVGHHDHIFHRNAAFPGDVTHKGIHVLHDRREILRRTARARRTPVPTGVPRIDRDILQPEHLHHPLPASGVLMTPVEKQKRLVRGLFRNPRAVKELHAIPACHGVFRRSIVCHRWVNVGDWDFLRRLRSIAFSRKGEIASPHP